MAAVFSAVEAGPADLRWRFSSPWVPSCKPTQRRERWFIQPIVPTDRTRALELAVRGVATLSEAGGGDERHPVGEAKRPRSLSVHEGRPRTAACAAVQPDRGIAAPSLDTEDESLNVIGAIGKRRWPDAYGWTRSAFAIPMPPLSPPVVFC